MQYLCFLVPAEVPVVALVRCVDVGVAVGIDLGFVPVVGAPVLVVGIVLVPAEAPVPLLAPQHEKDKEEKHLSPCSRFCRILSGAKI